MEVSAELVKQLRERTGIGMMECKGALLEAGCDMEKAIAILRKKGYARAADKSGRETKQGLVQAYIHMEGKIGVLVEVACESDFVARNEEFKEMSKNLAMQVAASNPKYIAPEDIPAEILEQEKEIIREQMKDTKKPPEIMEKIVQGKLAKFYSEVCLNEQPYIKEDKQAVKQYIASFVAKFGENIRVNRFARFEIGNKK